MIMDMEEREQRVQRVQREDIEKKRGKTVNG
jgi:hypothetical protein